MVSRKWLLRSNMGLFSIMLDSDESIAFFYTPITPDDIQITVGKRKLAWVAHEIRMKALIKNITKVTTEDDWPAQTVLFMTYLTNDRSTIPNNFLLPFENKMLAFKRSSKAETYSDDKRKALMVSCFLIIKLVVAKILFKPFKITDYFDKDINGVRNKQALKENCISMGYSLIALMTDYLVQLFSEELTSQQIDLNKP